MLDAPYACLQTRSSILQHDGMLGYSSWRSAAIGKWSENEVRGITQNEAFSYSANASLVILRISMGLWAPSITMSGRMLFKK